MYIYFYIINIYFPPEPWVQTLERLLQPPEHYILVVHFGCQDYSLFSFVSQAFKYHAQHIVDTC